MSGASRWSYPGARWWKFDFHSHTPASTDTHWSQTGEEITPKAWLLRYMLAEIDCVAITDHNSGAWIDRLKSAYASMESSKATGFRPLQLFPGVEISVSGGFHLLALFDITTTSADIDTLLGHVDYAGTKGDTNGVTRKSASEVVEALTKLAGLAIPAHADRAKGLLECKAQDLRSPVLDAQTLGQLFRSKKILAAEVVDPNGPKPQVYDDEACRWTEVLGSDSHGVPGKHEPGSRYTWIKMAAPSLEGLRLALLDGPRFSVHRSDAEGSFDARREPEHLIKSIEIHNARYMGRGIAAALSFNPWFNALVGGRGSGKSTIVHALRLAYHREGELERLGDRNGVLSVFAKFAAVHKTRSDDGGLENDTSIRVLVSRDGVTHRLSWSAGVNGVTVEEQRDDEWVASAGMTPELCPVRIFSQGQIAALADETQGGLLGLIDEDTSVRVAKRALDEATRRFLVLRAQTRELDGKLKGREEIRVKLADVKRKLAGFDGSEHTEILKDYQRRVRQERELGRQRENASVLAGRAESLAQQLITDDPPDALFDASDAADRAALETIQRIRNVIAKASDELRAAGHAIQEVLSTLSGTFDTSPWEIAARDAKRRHAALTGELARTGVTDTNEYGKFVQERHRLESELERFASLQTQRDALAIEAITARSIVRRERRSLRASRRAFLDGALQQNAYVRIEVLPYDRDPRATDRALREALGLEGETFKDELFSGDDEDEEGLVVDLHKDLPPDVMSAASELEARIDALGARFERAVTGATEFGARFSKHLQQKSGQHPEMIDRLLVFSPEDSLKIEYSPRGDGAHFKPIAQASAGQAAAAILAFLLAHGAEPMVLDQPEDDLDNHLIYDLVVQQIRENKQRRQLIVVTHNPNIVVNGDAEMIHALDFTKGQCRVVQSGSLQDTKMRVEVCRIIEGGSEAFERRYQRLGDAS